MGVTAPATLYADDSMPTTTPFATTKGDVFVAMGESVLYLCGGAEDGVKARLSWQARDLGFKSTRVYAVAFDDATSTLLLSDWAGSSSELAAFAFASPDVTAACDAAAPVELWRTPRGAFDECDSIAVLCGGRVAATSRSDKRIHIHDLGSGTRLFTAQLSFRPRNVAFDLASGLLFVATPMFSDGGSAAVCVFQWDGETLRCGPGGEGGKIGAGKVDVARAEVAEGFVPGVCRLDPTGSAVLATGGTLPLVTVARNAASGSSQLIVCSWGGSAADVYAIPSCTRVARQEVDEAAVSSGQLRLMGLCSDALGEALVYVAGSTIKAAPWRPFAPSSTSA
jgi:hypothetical protein